MRSGKVVNLRAVRKGKARTAKKSAADANAAKYGRTRAERAAEADAKARADRLLDGHRRDE